MLDDHNWGGVKLPADSEHVQGLLLQLGARKSIWPDGIHPRILKVLSDFIRGPLSIIF